MAPVAAVPLASPLQVLQEGYTSWYRLALLLTGSPQQAEDVVHNSYPTGPAPTRLRAPGDPAPQRRTEHPGRGSWGWAAVAAAVAASLVVACVLTWSGDRSEVDCSTIPPAPLQDVDALQGTWLVHDYPREGPEFKPLQAEVMPGSLLLSWGCTAQGLAWSAHPDGLLLLTEDDGVDLRDQDVICGIGTPWQWAGDVAGFDVRSDELVGLLDRDGTEVAQMTRTAAAPPRTRPVPTPAFRTVWSPRPVTCSKAAGTRRAPYGGDHWMSWTADSVVAQVDCANTGGFDAAVSVAGGLLIGELVTMTEVGCGDEPQDSWPLVQAARAGLDGEVVVLFDAEGTELTRPTQDGGADGEVLLMTSDDSSTGEMMAALMTGTVTLTEDRCLAVQGRAGEVQPVV